MTTPVPLPTAQKTLPSSEATERTAWPLNWLLTEVEVSTTPAAFTRKNTRGLVAEEVPSGVAVPTGKS